MGMLSSPHFLMEIEMGYCSISDVEVLLSQTITFSTTTEPTKEQVQQFIEKIALEVNAKLQQLYATPITGTESLKLIAFINALGVAAFVDQPIKSSTGEVNREGKDRLFKLYNGYLDDLINNKIILKDAVAASGTLADKVKHSNQATINYDATDFDKSVFVGKNLDSYMNK